MDFSFDFLRKLPSGSVKRDCFRCGRVATNERGRGNRARIVRRPEGLGGQARRAGPFDDQVPSINEASSCHRSVGWRYEAAKYPRRSYRLSLSGCEREQKSARIAGCPRGSNGSWAEWPSPGSSFSHSSSSVGSESRARTSLGKSVSNGCPSIGRTLAIRSVRPCRRERSARSN